MSPLTPGPAKRQGPAVPFITSRQSSSLLPRADPGSRWLQLRPQRCGTVGLFGFRHAQQTLGQDATVEPKTSPARCQARVANSAPGVPAELRHEDRTSSEFATTRHVTWSTAGRTSHCAAWRRDRGDGRTVVDTHGKFGLLLVELRSERELLSPPSIAYNGATVTFYRESRPGPHFLRRYEPARDTKTSTQERRDQGRVEHRPSVQARVHDESAQPAGPCCHRCRCTARTLPMTRPTGAITGETSLPPQVFAYSNDPLGATFQSSRTFGSPTPPTTEVVAWTQLTEHRLRRAARCTKTEGVRWRLRMPWHLEPGDHVSATATSKLAAAACDEPDRRPQPRQHRRFDGATLTLRSSRALASSCTSSESGRPDQGPAT